MPINTETGLLIRKGSTCLMRLIGMIRALSIGVILADVMVMVLLAILSV
jgi:hypothetical protein